MKIGFVTTIDTNIGDDFIRTGIENIIKSVRGNKETRFVYVNKHHPETAIRNNSMLNKLRNVKNFKGKSRLVRFIEDRFYHLNSIYRDQDLIIQSGAPVLWPGCESNEWAKPIWYKTISKLTNKIPVLNLAAGSCYPWENQGYFHSEKEANYARDIGGFCHLTTTRDTLASKLFNKVNINNILLPCTALFVDNNFSNDLSKEYILINYMEGGGHFDWGQKINKSDWEIIIKKTIKQLKEKYEVRFICHDEREVKIASELDSSLKIHFPKNVNEYLSVVKKAFFGINNRMHASVAMASVGVPSISICTDTRLLMLENIGLPIHYVKEINTELLIKESTEIIEKFEEYKNRLFELKKEKFSEYCRLLSPYIV